MSLARRERSPFVIAEYDEGSLIEMPLECPWRRDDAPCDVVRHALRHRRTEPLHAVVVCRCHAHGSLFRVYPPGFVPYARRYLDAVAFGDASSSTGPEVAASRTPARAPGHEPLHGLGRAMAFVHGIRLGETVALALHVPLRLAAAVRQAVDARTRARAVAALLGAVGDHGRLLLGALVGRWGAPFRWYRFPQRLERLVPAHLVDIVRSSTSSDVADRRPREQ